MTRDEFNKIWAVLHALWPVEYPVDNEDAKQVWGSRLQHHDYRLARAAVNEWLDTHRKGPKVADVIEGIRKQGRVHAPRGERQKFCGECDHGWEWADIEGQGTVSPCRNGCKPPAKSEFIHDPTATGLAPEIAARLRETMGGLKPPYSFGGKSAAQRAKASGRRY